MPELALSNDVTIHYEHAGSGMVLVLVHGLAGSSRFFADAAEDLARHHHVISVDLRGHGRSSVGSGGFTLAAAAADLHDVMRHLGLEEVVLVGWSLGATVAFNYLDLFGTGRIAKLVSIEQTPYLLAEDGWQHAAFGGLDAEGARSVTYSIKTDPVAFSENLVRTSFAAGADPDPATLRALIAEAAKCSPMALAGLWADALRNDWRTRVGKIEVPVLLVHGAKSQVYPTDVGGWLVNAIPNARLEVFEDSGHLPFVEEQARFTEAIGDFAAR